MIEIIAWVGVSQALFASFLIFTKKENSQSDKVLSLWLALLALDFLSCALDYLIFSKPLLSSSFLLFNPALFLYICSLTDRKFSLRPVNLLHLVPYLLFKLIAYWVQEAFAMNTFFDRDSFFLYRIAFGTASVISSIVYNFLSLRLVHRHRVSLQAERSNIDQNESIGWVLFVSVSYTVYCIIAVVVAMVSYFTKSYPLSPHIYNYAVLLGLIYILSFYGLYQLRLSLFSEDIEEERIPYQKSLLTTEAKGQIQEKIEEYVVGQKAYLDPNLSMEVISKKLKVPKYQLTEVLNTVIGKNFFQYVNHFRVEEVKKMLSDKDNTYSIEAIGFDCGFASKSSFYTLFKNATGMTPTAYRDSLA